jgi:DNA repair protein SbcC/Rad50
LKGQNHQLGPETEPLKARIVLLEASTAPQCPTCGQPLTPEHRRQVAADLQAEVQARRNLYAANQARLKAIQSGVASVDYQLAQVETELRQLPNLHRREAELKAAIEAAREAARSIEHLAQRRSEWQAALDLDRRTQSDIAAQIGSARAGLGDLAQIQTAYEQVRRDEAYARKALGAAEQKLAACEALIKQREVKLAERQQRAADKGIYEELRLAFGKKGVPAMIIEAAIPEIEDGANALLTRITGGRMHLRFDTQRETVKGDTVETLDIKIADELGTRPYECYSGGEQCRVNFAVRIALSKLLARRAGAQLQTLVIDEGFGALDSAGRDRLVEAINVIQDDFQRILVITHLDELKDAFPVRIEVTKTGEGSMINVQ